VLQDGVGSVVPLDLTADPPTLGTPVSGFSTGAQDIVISPDGSTIYVSDPQTESNSGCCEETVTTIASADSSVENQFVIDGPVTSPGSGSIALTPDGSTLYAGSQGLGLTPMPTSTDVPGNASAVCNTACGQLAITPDQGPTANLAVQPGVPGAASSFNASGSAPGSSPIVNYAWSFGDGNTANTSTPTTTHTYASPGSYTASVTETDAAGTSTTQIFTGQAVSGNGSPKAEASSAFQVLSGVQATYACVVSGFSGSHSFPAVVAESPAPPGSVDAGGTFSTSPGAQLTVPASVINHFIGMGATSLTIAAQTTTLDGRSSVGGGLSGAVSPNTESGSASNLPQSDSALKAGVPYTYDTSYNPVTFTTGPGTGKVYVTPGDINAEVTFVIHGTATPESITCTPPAGAAALGSTIVEPPPSSPTFQVSSPTPPLQNQVSAGTVGGWATTITDTSTASVTGLSATVTVGDGHGPVTFDLAGMAASGTNCSNAGSGKLSCSIGNLAAGASSPLDVLVNTSGVPSGTAISGSASVSSSNAGSHVTTLGAIGVVVVQGGNGTKAVATPGVALVSTKKPLKSAKATVRLTLPTKKIKVTKKAAEADPLAKGTVPFASGAASVNPPPVAVTLETLAPSAEPALCPPTGSTKCEGNIVQAFGNFSAYTNNKAPIVAVVQFFYGLHVPKGSVYFLKPNGKSVDRLSVCKKTAGAYDTPCLAVPEKTLGTAAHDSLYTQDTVYFTGNDPAMGRR
jgi:hypothetical protein